MKSPKNLLFLICGIAFSGKTVFSGKLAQVSSRVRISLDDINEKRGLDPCRWLPPEEWTKTYDEALARLEAEMEKKSVIIVDDSFCLRLLRDRFKSVAGRYGYTTIIIFIDVSEREARRRITENRIKKTRNDISDSFFNDHLKEFEKPHSDENALTFNSENGNMDEFVNYINLKYLKDNRGSRD
jgi:predicted kinase